MNICEFLMQPEFHSLTVEIWNGTKLENHLIVLISFNMNFLWLKNSILYLFLQEKLNIYPQKISTRMFKAPNISNKLEAS